MRVKGLETEEKTVIKHLKLKMLSTSMRTSMHRFRRTSMHRFRRTSMHRFRRTRVVEFYEPILPRIKNKIDPLIRTYGLEKIVKASERLDYVKVVKRSVYAYSPVMWIRANESVYLKLPIGDRKYVTKGYIFLFNVSEKEGEIVEENAVAIPNLSEKEFNDYQSNLLRRMTQFSEHMEHLYDT